VRLLAWSPTGGFWVKDAQPGGGNRARVEFESDNVRVRVQIRCAGGVPSASVERKS